MTSPAGADPSSSRLGPGLSEWRYPIDRSMTATAAIAIILRTLLEVVVGNQDGLAARRGDEPLHDYRVAVRRTRSALSLYAAALPPAIDRRGRSLFKDLGRRTNAARDLDVLLLALPEYVGELPEVDRAGLGALEESLHRKVAREYAALRRWLEGKTYAAKIAAWRRNLEALTHASAGESITALSAGAIDRAYAAALAQIDVVRRESSGASIHRLRIRFKKLRYALEFARALTPGGEAESFIVSLKLLQDELGTNQDLAIHRKWLAESAAGGGASPESARTAEVLIEVLDRRRARLRESILADVSAFGSRARRDLAAVLTALRGDSR